MILHERPLFCVPNTLCKVINVAYCYIPGLNRDSSDRFWIVELVDPIRREGHRDGNLPFCKRWRLPENSPLIPSGVISNMIRFRDRLVYIIFVMTVTTSPLPYLVCSAGHTGVRRACNRSRFLVAGIVKFGRAMVITVPIIVAKRPFILRTLIIPILPSAALPITLPQRLLITMPI